MHCESSVWIYNQTPAFGLEVSDKVSIRNMISCSQSMNWKLQWPFGYRGGNFLTDNNTFSPFSLV